MYRFIICSCAVLILVSFGEAQRKPRVPSPAEQADAAWPKFLKTFRDAVNRRDKEALKPMMVPEFFFSGGSDENGDGDTRDEAFKFLDDPQVHGWQAFAKVLARGAVATKPEPTGNTRGYPRRVAPPEARRIRSLTNAPPWLATFEFRNGQWYCTMLSECCD
jgi:hypothetical protein